MGRGHGDGERRPGRVEAPAPPPVRPLAEVLAEHARRGDVAAVYEAFRRAPPLGKRVDVLQRALDLACAEAARRDPQGFALELTSRMVGVMAGVMLRAHALVRGAVASADGRTPYYANADGLLLAEDLLPRIEKIHNHLLETLLAQATIARRWSLAGDHGNRAPAKVASGGERRAGHDRVAAPRAGRHAVADTWPSRDEPEDEAIDPVSIRVEGFGS